MSENEIPDPTELREKLGIAKKKAVHTPLDGYRPPDPGFMQKMGNQLGVGATLADFEAEPRLIDEAESQKIDEFLKDLPEACARYLKKYIVLGNKSVACRAIDYSAGTINFWKRKYPAFAHLALFYEDEVRQRWNEVAERRALQGFKEDVFDTNGKLKHTKMRQDAQFLVQMMKKMDPDWKDEQLGTQITINVIREEE